MLSQYYRTFGLTDSEIAALASARMKRDYFYKSPNGARLFQLELDDFQLALIAPPKSVLDEMERQYGRNSGKELAAQILLAQGFNPGIYLKDFRG